MQPRTPKPTLGVFINGLLTLQSGLLLQWVERDRKMLIILANSDFLSSLGFLVPYLVLYELDKYFKS